MKNAKKIVVLLLCAVLLIGASIAGTVAYLTDNDTVTNTFTVGEVGIELKEYAVDAETGAIDKSSKVDGLQDLKLIPGRTIDKNPFITVDDGSEDCWLFVKVDNGLEGAGVILWANGWTPVDGAGYYKYESTVEANAVIDVFTAFKCDADLTNDTLADYNNKSIVITAYAVQAEGLDQTAAFAALNQ